jgi:hypothetical protein
MWFMNQKSGDFYASIFHRRNQLRTEALPPISLELIDYAGVRKANDFGVGNVSQHDLSNI